MIAIAWSSLNIVDLKCILKGQKVMHFVTRNSMTGAIVKIESLDIFSIPDLIFEPVLQVPRRFGMTTGFTKVE